MKGAAGRVALGQGTGDFFIPDLCGPRSVFLLVLLAELLVIVHVLASSDLQHFDWRLLASGSFLSQWVTLLSAAVLCQLRGPLSGVGLVTATLVALALVALITLFSSFVAQRLPAPYGGSQVTDGSLARNVIVALVVAGVALRYFYLQQQLRHREQLELQSRLDNLRDRIRPHFLFNTLNSIASLIASRPEAAERAVEDLSELFRVSLHEDRRDTTVADELHLCELYLGIEKLRLGDRLRVDWRVDPPARVQPMPSLILQPLVENAIYHGISTLPDGGSVRIGVRLDGGHVVVEVENPLSANAVPSRGHNLALDNIRRRLDALYGGAGALEVEPGETHFRVRLRYPRDAAA